MVGGLTFVGSIGSGGGPWRVVGLWVAITRLHILIVRCAGTGRPGEEKETQAVSLTAVWRRESK